MGNLGVVIKIYILQQHFAISKKPFLMAPHPQPPKI